ncbi:MAG: hypothetical protein M1827_001294 [Pycnora praestabilis]|nr:MAG: hypothetical protein M1827_001294 [Pycnora praestabilis]
MAAETISTFTIVVPNPEWASDSEGYHRVNDSISFHLDEDSNIRTLSTDTATSGGSITGLLYVPDLAASDPCVNTSKQYVPHNVTRQANLPSTDYDLIALAPWISANCTLSYLASARGDPVRAFIFYPTDNSAETPPLGNDPVWGLHDGGQWKSTNKYPVYAVPGETGATMMKYLGHYSGNMTDVDYGHQLTETFDSRDYARLYTEIGTGGHSSLPSLWVFLLIVLAILMVIIGLISFLMHWIQHKHRQLLRRRIANGEVDLEALGIKMLTVPQVILDKMPLFVCDLGDNFVSNLPAAPVPTYNSPLSRSKFNGTRTNHLPPTNASSTPPLYSSTRSSSAPTIPGPSTTSRPTSPNDNHAHSTTLDTDHEPALGEPPPMSELPHRVLPFAQATCAICLNDFQSHVSTVRQLPCGHIFHPDCVDTFFRNSSSLCPLCKKSVLPKGYCPETVTNAMVRRERLVRTVRERVVFEVSGEGSIEERSDQHQATPMTAQRRMASLHRRFGRRSRVAIDGRRVASAPSSSTLQSGAATSDLSLQPRFMAEGQRPPDLSRADWARRRARAMLNLNHNITVETFEREARVPQWRKALGAVFPAIL